MIVLELVWKLGAGRSLEWGPDAACTVAAEAVVASVCSSFEVVLRHDRQTSEPYASRNFRGQLNLVVVRGQ